MILNGKSRVVMAFAVVIAVMASIVGFALSTMHELQREMDQVVSVNAEKLRQIDTMRRSNRERIIGLQKMLLVDDPFVVDEIAMAHMGHANRFIAARAKLVEMAATQQERRALERIRATSMVAAPLNDKIRDLALDEELEQARTLMLEELSPAQNAIYAEFEHLAAIYESTATQRNDLAKRALDAGRTKLWALLGLVSVLCVLLGAYVARHISRSEQALKRHSGELELMVATRTRELSEQVLERQRAESVAQNESKRLAVTLASIGDGVVTVDHESHIHYINPAAEKLTLLDQDMVIGKHVDEVLNWRQAGKAHRSAAGDANTCENVLERADGTAIDIQHTVAQITDEHGATHGSVIVLRDVSEARALARRLEHEATHDALTGLVNRREFENRLEAALHRARIDATCHTLCYIDLDRFKAVNDTCGHAAGDQLLCELTRKVSARLRKGDTLARLGGDEFGVLLDQCGATKGVEIAESIRQIVQDYRLYMDGQELRVGASIGVVEIAPDTLDLETLLAVADAACYAAKERGRDCVQVFHPGDRDIIERRGETRIARQIRHGLEQGKFELFAQPIVPATPAGPDGVQGMLEVLLRLRTEDGELLCPDQFMAAADRYGLLADIDRLVVARSLAWLGANQASMPFAKLTINLAGVSVSDPQFLDFVTDTLAASGASPDRVVFEITESVAVTNLGAATRLMDALHARGCEFALDDFGRGFSSFGSLKDLPVDYLKIDGHFVSDVLQDRDTESVIQAINEVGHALGKRTVAEFVENDAIKARLREFGVDYLQGFGIAQPAPIERFIVSAASQVA